MSTLPPAGWYDDPEQRGQLRYWDGGQWTEHRSPVGGTTGSGRLSDIGSWLGDSFRDLWERRIPVLAMSAMLMAAWIATVWTISWSVSDLVWFDGDWSGVDEGRIFTAAVASVALMLFSLGVYMALFHQMHRYRLGQDPSIGDSLGAGLRAMPKVIGWAIVLTVAFFAATVVVGIVAVAAAPVAVLMFLGAIPLLIWVSVKLAFFLVALVAPVAGRSPFSASAEVSNQGRFWPVLGRLALLALIGTGISWALSLPLSAGAGPTGDFDNIIEVDNNDELILFHVGDFLDEIGITGGAILLASVIPQLCAMLLYLSGATSLYVQVHGDRGGG